MKKYLCVVILLFSTIMCCYPSDAKVDKDKCVVVMKNGKEFPLYGKVKIVESFPDVKVQIVNSFPDVEVKLVDSFADECGKVKLVENFPDVKVQIVNSFPDVKVKIVESFPGVRK